MTTAQGPLLLDTNVVLHLVRGNDYGRRIDEAHNLHGRAERPLISIVTWGELLAFAKNHGWGVPRMDTLLKVVRQLVVVDITVEIVEQYAIIRDFLWKRGATCGDNDAWIAATAAAMSAVLITTDADFDPLGAEIIQLSRFVLTPGQP